MTSILTKKQTKTYGPRTDAKLVNDYGAGAMLTAEVRHDDECGNGCNSFAVTGTVVTAESRRRRDIAAGGCLHEDITRLFPELVPAIKYHLMSTDEPLHYVANTLYWLGYQGYCDGKANSPPNLEHARSSAVWPDMPESLLAPRDLPEGEAIATLAEPVRGLLLARKDALMIEFRAAVESLGFIY